jgi:flavin reductase
VGPLWGDFGMISDETFKLGFRRLASGVSCVTTRWNGQQHGFVATSVSSLCGDPPTLIVCVNRTVSSHDPISESGILCVNVLCHGDHAIAALFGDKDRRQSRFSGPGWTEMTTGSPVLREALVAFDCVIDARLPYGTHTIFIARIVDALVSNSSAESPLLYFDGSFRELGERLQ